MPSVYGILILGLVLGAGLAALAAYGRYRRYAAELELMQKSLAFAVAERDLAKARLNNMAQSLRAEQQMYYAARQRLQSNAAGASPPRGEDDDARPRSCLGV
jgi:hypothetical protein